MHSKNNRVEKSGREKDKNSKGTKTGDDTWKFDGSAKYRCRFDQEWSKKKQFIQVVTSDSYSFYCTVCSENVSCSHQAFRDVTHHRKSSSY